MRSHHDDMAKSTDSILNDLYAEKLKYSELPSEYLEMRAEIYGKETSFLQRADLFDDNDRHGTHYLLRRKSTGEILATTLCVPADKSDFYKYSNTDRDQLKSTVLATRGMVKKEVRKSNLFGIILYWAFSDSRFQGFSNIVSYVENADIPAKRIIGYKIEQAIPSRTVTGATGKTYDLFAFHERIPQALNHIFDSLPTDSANWISENIMVRELQNTIQLESKKFYSEGKFARSVRDGTLSEKQYTESCMNHYAYARWTTRLLAKLVAATEDRMLSDYFLEHLNIAANRDLVIEKDLEHLGVNLLYVKHQMVPHTLIQQSMAIQENLMMHNPDPILQVANSLIIETIRSIMPQSFISALYGCAKSWGYDQPTKICSFFGSQDHANSKIDDFGTFGKTIVGKHLRNERQMQLFLSLYRTVIENIRIAHDRFVEDIPAFIRRAPEQTPVNIESSQEFGDRPNR